MSLYDLYKEAEMWLVNMETTCVDYPRVSGAHYRLVVMLQIGACNECCNKLICGLIIQTTWPIVPRAFAMHLFKRMENTWFCLIIILMENARGTFGHVSSLF